MVLTNNKEKVLDSYYNYLETQDGTSFTEEAGLWVCWYAKNHLKADEDECSEIFLKFWQERERFFRYFHERALKNVIGYLTVLAKNSLIALRKKNSIRQLEWDLVSFIEYERHLQSDPIKNSAQELITNILGELPIEERLIAYIRFNIPLPELENKYLEKMFTGREKELQRLRNLIKERQDTLSTKNQKLLNKIGLYNQKIISKHKHGKNRKLKTIALAKVLKREEILTVNELLEFFPATRHWITKTVKNSLQKIEEEFPMNVA
jgi:hypothetical protein